ncbi:hypothetical protein GBF38_011526 [Nibea albiflora]|uniref:Uncharacterized protein n=1 Tax=Nibea albiflora TaxID=240163 RepID=A0ACB7F7E3_NIBAL|nr:hypothetical protein GBF38_011526 [Nibea albiflora]
MRASCVSGGRTSPPLIRTSAVPPVPLGKILNPKLLPKDAPSSSQAAEVRVEEKYTEEYEAVDYLRMDTEYFTTTSDHQRASQE